MNRRATLQHMIMCIILTILCINIANAKTPVQALSIGVFENINLVKKQSILLVTIDNPPRNSVSKKTLSEINNALDFAEKNTDIKAIVITGTNEIFSAGAGSDGAKIKLKGDNSHAFLAREVYNRIERFPKLIIAAISGISSGGGNELALACDIRIASDKAIFAQPELEVGLIPGFGGMQRLPRHVGLGRAMEIMLTGRAIKAEEALSIGLISSIFSDELLTKEAIELAKRLSEKLNANALAQFKLRMAISASEPLARALQNDQLTFDQIFYSKEGQEALNKYIKKNTPL